MATFNEPPALGSLNAPDIPSPSSPIEDPFTKIDPNNPRWGVLGALGLWLASIFVQFITPLFFIIPYALHRGLNPGSPDFGRAALELSVTDKTAIFLQILSIFPAHLLTLAMVWALVTRLGKRPLLESLGWGSTRGRGYWEGAGFVITGVVLFLMAAPLTKFLGGDKTTQLEQIINSSVASRYAIAALAVFTAPFVEEFIYRGVLYAALQRAIGTNAAVVLVLGLFTLIHVPQYWPNLGVISAVALLSIVLTIVRAYSGRLLPCVVIHMSFNAVQALLLIFEPLFRHSPPPQPVVPNAGMLIPLLRFLA